MIVTEMLLWDDEEKMKKELSSSNMISLLLCQE